MTHKDPLAAAASKRAYYLAHRDAFILRSTQRRLKAQAERAREKLLRAAEPAVIVVRTCVDCSKDITNAYVRKHGHRCGACVAKYQQAYRAANAERIAEKKRQWKLDNKEHVAEKDRLYAVLHPERRTKARNKWAAANPGKNTAAKARNHQARNKRVPTWLSVDDLWLIEQAYDLAALRTKLFGFSWHVDHVIPLNGKRVSGLHLPTNLQVIPWLDNLRKGNRVEVV